MLWAILNKSCPGGNTPQGTNYTATWLPSRKLSKLDDIAGHCWRSKDELISDVHLWTPTYGRAKAGRSARTYIQQLCENTGCSPEDLPEAMNDKEKWRERVRDIRASGTTWWWWWWRWPLVMNDLSHNLLSRMLSRGQKSVPCMLKGVLVTDLWSPFGPSWKPYTQLSSFSLHLLVLSVKNTLKTLDEIHWTTVSRKLEIQLSCLLHL